MKPDCPDESIWDAPPIEVADVDKGSVLSRAEVARLCAVAVPLDAVAASAVDPIRCTPANHFHRGKSASFDRQVSGWLPAITPHLWPGC